jgi:hypothetical protein
MPAQLSPFERARIEETAKLLAARGGVGALPALVAEGRLPPLQVGEFFVNLCV